MNIELINTKRKFEHRFYYDIVYEWEDCLLEFLNARLFYECTHDIVYPTQKIRLLRKIGFYPHKYSLVFDMDALLGAPRPNSKYLIPWIIDFYLDDIHLPRFNNCYRNHPLVLVSGNDAYHFLLDNRRLCPDVNFKYLPLSLPDKYSLNPQLNSKKDIEVVLFGNQDSVLYSFFTRYVSSHPDLFFAYRKRENGRLAYYTNDNSFLCFADTRQDYFRLMHRARISLYSTSIQYTALENRGFRNFNHVTPRFLELVSCGCHILMRYENNRDTEFYGLNAFSYSLDDYEAFEEAMEKARGSEVNQEQYSKFLNNHYTSSRAMALQSIINAL